MIWDTQAVVTNISLQTVDVFLHVVREGMKTSFLLLCPFLFGANSEKGLDNVIDNKGYCERMRKEYSILPGKSFGSLPKRLHAEYLHAACHRFFCEPHPKAGKGVFDCVPLANTSTSSES